MDANGPLNVLEQQLTSIYTQISLCYPLADDASQSAIVDTLNNGLERLAESFPWIAGQVVNKGASDGNSGIFSIKPLDKTPRLVIKDLRQDPSAPTWDALKEAEFPFRLLDENVIAPRNTIPGTEREPLTDGDVMPVFHLQANFMDGGLLLTFNGHHQAMDMNGQGFMIDLLSKACRNEPFTSEELAEYNPDRNNMIPLFDESWQPTYELDRHMVKPPPTAPETKEKNGDASEPAVPPPASWAYFLFSSAALASVKSLASKTIPDGSKWISTDDALTALVWQSIIRARQPRLDSDISVTLTRAVDMRRMFDISPRYPGVVLNTAFFDYQLSDLLALPLGAVASCLRKGVDSTPSELGHLTTALATMLNRTPDKAKFNFMSNLDMGSDLMISSWSRVNCYELDFGLGLGKPEAVRRPALIEVEGFDVPASEEVGWRDRAWTLPKRRGYGKVKD